MNGCEIKNPLLILYRRGGIIYILNSLVFVDLKTLDKTAETVWERNIMRNRQDWNIVLKNAIFTIVILIVFFCLSLVVEKMFKTYSLIPAIFTLAVFLISLLTEGYYYGIVASLLSVLALNYAFTFPFFKFNFSIPENLVSAVIMLIITVVSSTLVTKVRQQEKVKAETEKEKMRANLLRAISHDLRTPLTTIYGSSSAIIDKYDLLSKEQLLQLAKGIKEDSQWLTGMVENLLSVTKIDGDGVKLIKTPVVLEELIDSVLIKFKKRYPDRKIDVDIPDDFISIPMDAVLIEQVIVNILENAVLHAEGMTSLSLKVSVLGKMALFEISDDGVEFQKTEWIIFLQAIMRKRIHLWIIISAVWESVYLYVLR